MKPDFSGYATKAGLKCSDGRTITPEAFKHMDGKTVPLVWQHGHNEPANVLGHAVLEARDDGMYCYGFFNQTPSASQAKALVQHKDITSLSIYANQLVEKAKQVFHGVIREVSLVLSGANPGALIDNVSVVHGDNTTDILDDEAVIYTGLRLQHDDSEDVDAADDSEDYDDEEDDIEHAVKDAEDLKDGGADDASEGDATIQDVYDSLTPQQKQVVHYMIGAALEAAPASSAKHSEQDDEDDLAHDDIDQEGQNRMNVFERGGKTAKHGAIGGNDDEGVVLSHSDVQSIVEEAKKIGSLKRAVENYALQHGIENIDVLFPEAKNIDNEPQFLARRTEWVAGVLNGTRHTPFSRIRTRSADITHEEARAKGYIKGNLKKEEFFGVVKRVTTPTTVYKKQQLDRDDMLDITDFDVVMWLKGEMRLMLEEEIARAILIGDGRDVSNEDKIKDPAGASEGAGIRSILNDHELYVTHVNVALPATNADYNDVVEAVMRARRFYRGTGVPTFYATTSTVVEMLLSKDAFGRRRWNTKEELGAALGVGGVVEVEVMDQEPDLLGILVNLQDYSVGTDQGGDISLFDFFDIDYNQYKYLIETRCSGALTKIKSAMVVHRQSAGDVLITPTAPVFDGTTVTIPTDANINYFVDGVAAADGSTHAVAPGETAAVTAEPTAGHYFATNEQDQWSFTGQA